jgi:DNA gyrase/topoisomerase IV subunit A
MKVKKLLKSLSELMDSDRREQIRHYDEMKKVLKKLKKKRDELREELEQADEGSREKIAQRLEIIVAQRRKGIALIKELKPARHKNGESGPESGTESG